MSPFRFLFAPRSIAIVGASADEASIGGQPQRFLREHGYAGAVYPVNPRYTEIGDLPCYPSLESLPARPDLVLIAVAARRVCEMLRQCGEQGIGLVIVLSSGFAEMGPEGQAAQDEIAALARHYSMRVIGPNCQGMMNISEGYALGFGAPFGLKYRPGALSLTSQSGAFGNSVLMLAEQEGLGFRHYLSTGNEADTSTLDLIEHFIEDPQTRMMASYVEGFRDARRALDIGRRALAADKPWLVWKVGNSSAGARAAASHTANLSGAPALYKALLQQAGAISVHDVGDLADCVIALQAPQRPRGPRVAVITVSGGAGILMADRCEEAGLQLPALTEPTLQALRTFLPAFAALNNPVDLTAEILQQPEHFERALRLIAADPNVDMLALPLAALTGRAGERVADALVAVRAETPLPMLVAWNGPQASSGEAYARLAAAGIPRYSSPVRCARGLEALWTFTAARRRWAAQQLEALPSQSCEDARAALRQSPGDLSEAPAKQLLARYGITPTREILASSVEAALLAADRIGYPLVMKIQSAQIPHKTEAGGVRIGVRNQAELRRCHEEMMAAARAYAPDCVIDGVLIQEQVRTGVETILGVNNDPLFGPVLMFGLGGIHAEVMKDVSFRLLPLRASEAREMVHEIRAFPLLDGIRGQPKADVEALVSALQRLSEVALDLQDGLAELDINPLFVLPAGQGVRAGDALIKPLRSRS